MDLRFFASPVGQALSRAANFGPPATTAIRTELEPGYYVGMSEDLQYPGIISGPFDHRPKRVAPNNVLYRKTTTGSWVKDPVGFAA